jgi:hypothetical protein
MPSAYHFITARTMRGKFRVLKQSKLEKRAKPGTIVYGCLQCDYGCANQDSRHFKKPYASFTLKEDGGYPFFTMPVSDVERVIED